MPRVEGRLTEGRRNAPPSRTTPIIEDEDTWARGPPQDHGADRCELVALSPRAQKADEFLDHPLRCTVQALVSLTLERPDLGAGQLRREGPGDFRGPRRTRRSQQE